MFMYIVTGHESYLGCFYDAYDPDHGTSGRAVRVLPNALVTLRDTMTIGICITYCVTEGY